jgi:hypothetical protein
MGRRVHVVQRGYSIVPRQPGITERETLTEAEPPVKASLGILREFLQAEHDRTRGDRAPSLLLGQLTMRQYHRANFGGVVVAAILSQAHSAFPKAGYPGDHESAIVRGQMIFSQLRELTEDPEGRIQPNDSEGRIHPATRKHIEAQAARVHDPAIGIGRRILQQVSESGYYPAAGVVEDAVTALELVSYRATAKSQPLPVTI